MIIAISCIAAALALLLIFTIAVYLCYRLAFFVTKRDEAASFSVPDDAQYAPYRETAAKMITHARTLPYEEVWITADDGVKLFGRFYAGTPGAPMQIMFHGYKSAAVRDFCGGLPFALGEGYNVLLVDQRAHGKSGGRCLTMGVRERFDCLAWVNYAVARFGAETKIALYGISMGAATVLMASALPLPANVQGIVADCGYTSPADILKKVLRDMHLPVRLAYPLVRLGGRLFGGFDTEAASAKEALSHSAIPVCLMHGEDDRFVPCEMSRENFASSAAKNKRLVTFPEAGHGLSYFLDTDLYLTTVRDFLRSHS